MTAGTFILQDPTPFQTVELWVFSFLACTFCGDVSCREVQIIWGSQCDSRKHLPWGPHTPGNLWSLHEVIRICCCAFFQVSVASDPGRRGQHNMLSPFHSPFQSPFRSPMRSPFRSPFKNFGHPGGRTIDFDCEDDDMNLNCFILMFDLLLKQVVEPEIPLVPRLGPVLVILSVGWGLFALIDAGNIRLYENLPRSLRTTYVTICRVTAIVGQVNADFCSDGDNLGMLDN